MSDEGEDPPRPKRKIKKVMIVSSASSSDSDDSGPTTSTQKKRLRVLSDDGSDSSSGSWAMGAIRRRRALPGLRDSEGESESSGWATEHSDAPQTSSDPSASITASKSPISNKTKAVSGFTSDSSEGNCEKCSICLMKFLNQEVGTPQNCEHIFCLDCITEWSKNMNTCPVDRITFDSIVVRACAGGRVLRTEAVTVAERRPSMELMIIEDATVCEICNSADHEESMLLCDGCDLGFHMQCLTPPLTRIPADQWLCGNCYGVWRSSPIFFPYELPIPATREDSEPSTSTGNRRNTSARNAPTTSQSSRVFNNGASTSARRTTTPRTRKRRYKRRRRTVVVEYEVEGEGKFPITKTRRVKTRIKKRKTKKRQPRTAARRTHVLASVRAKLASIRNEGAPPLSRRIEGGFSNDLASRRASAGIPSLSLFGSDHQLDYFEEEEQGSEGASTAVAVRPTSSILSAYRQARRKMVTIPSPTHASSAPDLLSDILESQTLLHSKRSVVSVTVDGNVNIKLETRKRKESKPQRKEDAPLADKKEVDLTKSEGTRQAPSYPGQGRGWGGGYRYPREQNHQQNLNQGNQGNQGYGGRGGYDNGYGGPQQRGGPQSYDRRDDNNGQFNDYNNRRSHQYPNDDEPWNDRNRRFPDQNRGQNNQRNDDRRFSAGPVWRPNRPEGLHRQSFGGFENPLDMRVGHEPPPGPGYSRSNSYPEASRLDKPQPFHPLPQPPSFEFNSSTPDAEPEEDERSDEGLIIDTEKYDPTEPTNDDDSGEDDSALPGPAPPTLTAQERIPTPPANLPLLPPQMHLDAPSVETILAGIDTRGIDVPADILDSAVRQALEEHRAMLNPGRSRDDEGDCPNFSIYSATSVHIASDSGRVVADKPVERRNSLEDLVQGDGELTPPPLPMDQCDDMFLPELSSVKPTYGSEEKTREQYKAKVSKRCPITTNTRNPIKIKLNTPSLIKRQVSLYDDEDVGQDLGEIEEPATESQEESPTEAKSAAAMTTDEEKVQSEPEVEDQKSTDGKNDDTDASKDNKEDCSSTPHVSDDDATPKRSDDVTDKTDDKDFDDDRTDEELETIDKDPENKDKSDSEVSSGSRSPHSPPSPGRPAKMTESISETEDERSYTPCLDENKDASLEDKGIEGLDTEMISEEEGNDMFSEGSPPVPGAPPPEEGEILDKRPKQDDIKKKKKKEGKKEKEKSKGRKRDVAFKKIGKGKDRNYRERDKEKEKRRSPSSSRERRRRKDKRKDLERYDVRTLVTERRRKTKDAFGRDVSPSGSRSPSPSPSPPRRASSSPPIGRQGLSPSPRTRRARLSPSPRRVRPSPSPRRARSSISPRRGRPSPSPRRARFSPSANSLRRSPTPKRRRKRSSSRAKMVRRRRSSSRVRKRRRSPTPSPSPLTLPKPTKAKKKKRARSPTAGSKQKSPRRRKRVRRRSQSPPLAPPLALPPRLPSPRTPPPAEPVPLEERRRRREVERAHRRLRDAAGPSKEVFTSGDNILVSVSFKEQERAEGIGRRSRRKERRRRRRAAEPEAGPKPVAIIDLERSPFRELTPSPKNVIVLSDDEAERSPAPAAAPAPPEVPPQGPKTPPDPAGLAPAPAASPPKPAPEVEPRGPLTPPEPPDSPDAYDPYEPTRSASASPAPALPLPVIEDEGSRPSMTLEAAQKTNLSADEVLDRRPLSPIEKVMALLQSTRDVSPEEPQPRPAGASPGSCPLDLPPAPLALPAPVPAQTPAPRVLLPEVPRAPPKLFLAKPSPIKSDPIKPMPQATKISRLPLPAVVAGVRRRSDSPSAMGGASPYSPGSSDFGDLFEPPPPSRRDAFDALQDRPRGRKARNGKSKRGKRSKTTVDVKLDDDNLKILDELPSSAVEMQVKSKFLKKLNRQERVVEEVKLVLKPHYNKKHVSKDEYKHILRRAVPKICHNKTGEINPMKIQALVEAYVKKFRKKRKLGQ